MPPLMLPLGIWVYANMLMSMYTNANGPVYVLFYASSSAGSLNSKTCLVSESSSLSFPFPLSPLSFF